MSYPFPGMNPWLEDPNLWRDVHLSLIAAIRDDLSAQLAPRYFVAVETYRYITTPDPRYPQIRYPDVMVIEREPGRAVTSAAAAPEVESLVVELTNMDPLEEGFLEVRLVPGGQVVTVIELLSHTNKRRGEHREQYLAKRYGLLQSDVNFVELDLLRDGKPMPDTDPRPSDYRFFERRRGNYLQARVYPFNVRQPVPPFPLPLLPDDQEPLLDIGSLLKSVYSRARYDLVIDYSREPDPPLAERDIQWFQARIDESRKG